MFDSYINKTKPLKAFLGEMLAFIFTFEHIADSALQDSNHQ
jgi:hypothetical protein